MVGGRSEILSGFGLESWVFWWFLDGYLPNWPCEVHGCILMSLMKRSPFFEVVGYRKNVEQKYPTKFLRRIPLHPQVQQVLPSTVTCQPSRNRRKKPSTSQSPETGYWNPPPDPGFPFTRNTGVKLTPTGPCMDRGNLPGSSRFRWVIFMGALWVYWRIIPGSQWLITMVRTSPKAGLCPFQMA